MASFAASEKGDFSAPKQSDLRVPRHEGLRRRGRHAAMDRFVERCLHQSSRRGNHHLRHRRFQEGKLFGRDAMRLIDGRENRAAQLGSFRECFFGTFDQRDDDVLHREAAEVVAPCFRGGLLGEEWRMAGMRNHLRNVGAAGEFADVAGGRIERNQRRAGLHPRHRGMRDLADRRIRNCQHDEIGQHHGVLKRRDVEARGRERLRFLRLRLNHQHRVLRMTADLLRRARAHLPSGAHDGYCLLHTLSFRPRRT